jgi:hypothetical protein
VAGDIPHDAWCSPIGLLNVSQAGLEPVSGNIRVLLLSQCNVAWRCFVWARGSGCESFDYFGALFFPSVALMAQQDLSFTEITLSASAP